MRHVFKYMDETRTSWYLCDILVKKRISKRYKDESKYFICHNTMSLPPHLLEKKIMDEISVGSWYATNNLNCDYPEYFRASVDYDRVKKYHDGNVLLHISNGKVHVYQRDSLIASLIMNTDIESNHYEKGYFYVKTSFPFDDIHQCLSTMCKHNIGFDFIIDECA